MHLSETQSRAHISRSSIQRLYIAMRHLFIRGYYKPLGMSGEAMINAMLELKPEIYGSVADPERVELNGLLYIFQRLPQGIEECRHIKLISREGLESSNFKPIVPSKRRRNCYRIDKEQMHIEMTRGRSDIYDILTHLTFMYIEAEKIRGNSTDSKRRKRREWDLLSEIIEKQKKGEEIDEAVAYTYLGTLLGRTYEETARACKQFEEADKVNNLFHIVYWLGKLSTEEFEYDQLLEHDRPGISPDREISFSSSLRAKLGHHEYGEMWANNIKQHLDEQGLLERPIHIISANMHSILNSLFAKAALKNKLTFTNLEDLAGQLSQDKNASLRKEISKYANKNGMWELSDSSGTNISVQVFDCAQIDPSTLPKEIQWDQAKDVAEVPVIVVMDYAFGEQAYETMDELLKPYEKGDTKQKLNIVSINIMGKAGILSGTKGDIMIPNAHVFEGSADNYPFENELTAAQFEGCGLGVFENGPMITVLGTSLQNKDILQYFLKSSWQAIGLEMEGAHYQKAIQAASKIRTSVSRDVKLRYAYYASDNPLETGSTLASGSLGLDGVKPTYLISVEILKGVFGIIK